MDEHLRQRFENLQLMRVVKGSDGYYVTQMNPATGEIGIIPGPELRTWQQAERYQHAWAGLDLDDPEDLDDDADAAR